VPTRPLVTPKLILAIALAGPAGAAELSGLAPGIDALFAPTAGQKLPGAAVVVLRGGEVVHSKAYGLADIERGIPNTTRTPLRLASVTKSFTALAVLQLVEDGRLRLDDPLERHLPGWTGGERITIRHLLTHTAGMPDFVSLEAARTMPRDAAPGERLNYSNVGYSVLGRIVESVAGRSLEDQLRERIFAPLGMADTGVDRRAAAGDRRGAGYLFGPEGRPVPAEYADTSGDPAAGGLSSTAEDMTRWVRALIGGRIVSPSTFAQAATPVTLADGRTGAYGYGFMLVPYRGLREVGHGGDISGFNSYVALYPDVDLAVVVLSNVGMRPPGVVPTAADVVHRIVEMAAGDRLGPPWPEVATLPASTLDGYVGRYRLDVPATVAEVMGEAIEISRDGERLVATGKQGRAEIFPESETAFFSKEGPVRITFVAGREGPEAVLTLLGLREFRLVRLP